jgi:hypothetical protein
MVRTLMARAWVAKPGGPRRKNRMFLAAATPSLEAADTIGREQRACEELFQGLLIWLQPFLLAG